MAEQTSRVQELRLLEDFDTYDRHVDVVSAFEWVFTEVGGMLHTVRHFERFPRVLSVDGVVLTPDFTVLFNDGTGIIGEIAKIALHDNSVDKLCAQIGKYAEVTALPDGTGANIAVNHVDVMQVVEMKDGLAAFERIIDHRYENPEHDYHPPEPPCIVQFSRDDKVYTFQRIRDSNNGPLCNGDRELHIQQYLDKGFNPRISGFAKVKVKRGFINDEINALYLATHLWTRTWPTLHGAFADDITVDPSATARLVREQYGVGRAKDVKRALELLATVGLAAKQADGTWIVTRRQLGRRGNRDVHKLIAARFSGRRPRKLVPGPPRTKVAESDTPTLF